MEIRNFYLRDQKLMGKEIYVHVYGNAEVAQWKSLVAAFSDRWSDLQ